MTQSEQTRQFSIGAHAECRDGRCGSVSRVVIDPLARAVTHLVVEPTHRKGLGRLVPLQLVEDSPGEDVQLACTLADFEELTHAEETQFLPAVFPFQGYTAGEIHNWPYYGLGSGVGLGLGLGMGNTPQPVTFDSLPLGEVAIQRGQAVQATDGDIGKVQGLVFDVRDHKVTHVLLQEGHLWASKEVAIPISMVTSVADGIQLNVSKQEVAELPAVDLAR